MKSRGVPGGKRSPPGDSGGVPPGNPLDMDISAARTLGTPLGAPWVGLGGSRGGSHMSVPEATQPSVADASQSDQAAGFEYKLGRNRGVLRGCPVGDPLGAPLGPPGGDSGPPEYPYPLGLGSPEHPEINDKSRFSADRKSSKT
jgi:hypothetical protein